MKTLFISSNPPNEWRNHAHIVTWLKTEGYDITTRNIHEFEEREIGMSVLGQKTHELISQFSLILFYSDKPIEQKSANTIELIKNFVELIKAECKVEKIKFYGIYSPPPRNDDSSDLRDVMWLLWSMDTMRFFASNNTDGEKALNEQHIYKPP
jgi:hypothetical protein